ncbi:Protein SLOW GREEN 1 like [Actinidia chinensis var. chinensis]|uniref:Protein SLOW GREEN 1 like n=1 Tax=Actinidia chinensis var. chinensis TaxID=1590841 RepID=A0A2R6PV76_ACTCC|nr:Protein SLOW GREEN 1 like [Actinidia chinensis var. chinensis]
MSITTSITTATATSRLFPIRCSSDSKPRRGFGPQPTTNNKNSKANQKTTSSEQQDIVLEKRKSSTKQSGAINRAPGLSFGTDGKSSNMDLQFEERLEAVKRSALEQKKSDESEKYGAIDYDAPVESDPNTIGLGTKIGIGAAIVVFGVVFALGDFLPTGSEGPTKEAAVINNKLSEEEKKTLQTRLQQYEATLAASPEDANALEFVFNQVGLQGTAVTLAELGEYPQAASLLEDLTKKKPNDPDAFRLLGEVKYELSDYEGSVAAYRRSAMVSKTVKFEILRGLTNSLLAAKKPDEAVQVLLVSRETLKTENSNNRSISTDGSTLERESQEVDPIQVELLLGKAYSDWGRVIDAVSVYDQLISRHPNDFRGYLAKGIILKENGRVGDAERMFIQARFFAPVKAKALVDRYSRQ